MHKRALHFRIGLSDYHTYSYLSTFPLKPFFKNITHSFNKFAKLIEWVVTMYGDAQLYDLSFKKCIEVEGYLLLLSNRGLFPCLHSLI